jgi:hypothetical protein
MPARTELSPITHAVAGAGAATALATRPRARLGYTTAEGSHCAPRSPDSCGRPDLAGLGLTLTGTLLTEGAERGTA